MLAIADFSAPHGTILIDSRGCFSDFFQQLPFLAVFLLTIIKVIGHCTCHRQIIRMCVHFPKFQISICHWKDSIKELILSCCAFLEYRYLQQSSNRSLLSKAWSTTWRHLNSICWYLTTSKDCGKKEHNTCSCIINSQNRYKIFSGDKFRVNFLFLGTHRNRLAYQLSNGLISLWHLWSSHGIHKSNIYNTGQHIYLMRFCICAAPNEICIHFHGHFHTTSNKRDGLAWPKKRQLRWNMRDAVRIHGNSLQKWCVQSFKKWWKENDPKMGEIMTHEHILSKGYIMEMNL